MSPGETPGTVRMLLRYRAADGELDGLREAYHRVSRSVGGAPGLLGNALLRSVFAPGEYAVATEWSDLVAFRAWADDPRHRTHTAVLDAYRDPGQTGARYEVYEVLAAYRY